MRCDVPARRPMSFHNAGNMHLRDGNIEQATGSHPGRTRNP